jgi:Flp pilus assembly pilin Flp
MTKGRPKRACSDFTVFRVYQFFTRRIEMLKKLFRNRKGQGLVEYALIIAGVTLVAAVGISEFGHKVSDMIDAVAVILPGAHAGDNGPIMSGHLLETTDPTAGPIAIDAVTIATEIDQPRLGQNLLGNSATEGVDGLIIESR